MTGLPDLPPPGDKTCGDRGGPDRMRCELEPKHPGPHAGYDGEDLIRW